MYQQAGLDADTITQTVQATLPERKPGSNVVSVKSRQR
jgi:Tfp pilus assembly protein FimV